MHLPLEPRPRPAFALVIEDDLLRVVVPRGEAIGVPLLVPPTGTRLARPRAVLGARARAKEKARAAGGGEVAVGRSCTEWYLVRRLGDDHDPFRV